MDLPIGLYKVSPKILTGSMFSLQIQFLENYTGLEYLAAGTHTLETKVPIFQL